jgi:mRNA interferase RelE/StbE
MNYEIIFKPSAEKSFSKLSKNLQIKIVNAIEQLSTNPRSPGVKKLKSLLNLYRIRVGDYRVIYSIEEKILIVLIVKIAHRSEIYKNL